MIRLMFIACALLWWSVAPAVAQTTACTPGETAKGLQTLFGLTGNKQLEFLADRIRATGLIDLPVPCQPGARISADVVELMAKGGLLLASGNVVFSDATGRISADRVEFNIEQGTGTFYLASGIMTLGPGANRAEFGNQDPDVFFWGEVIERLAADRYRITEGGFTTCVQPEPRWTIGSDQIVINRNDYALARNVVFRVKGVPLFYLPAIYYPMGDGERATGFLMPTYGTSTIRGSSISNAFFWAITRSQDTTLFHDWFARAGQGMGAEYRYVADASSSGEVRFYRFAQQGTQFSNDRGQTTLQGETSYEIRAGMVHAISPAVRVSARADYATSLITQQLYQQSIYQATNPVRLLEGGVAGNWGPLATRAFYQRYEIFSNANASTVYGSTPGVNASISPTRVGRSPIYVSANTDFSYLPYRSLSSGVVTSDNSVRRIDLAPTIRAPLSTLSFLTANVTAAYRRTDYSRGASVLEPVTRSYWTVRSEVVGPVFNKIWDTPRSTRTERKKHVIEPSLALDYVTDAGNTSRFPTTYGSYDVIVGGSTRLTYGLTNRFLSRSRGNGATAGSSHEFLTIQARQTYYSKTDAARWDTQYPSALYRPLDSFSPFSVGVRVSPSPTFSVNAQVEYDFPDFVFPSISLSGSISNTTNTSNVSYSRVEYSPTSRADYITGSHTMRLMQGRTVMSYSLNWDMARSYIVSQSINAAYLAQCCGLQVEYQQFNFPDLVGFPVTSDRRFNVGIVLAGLGTFSNFFGAFGGAP